MRKASAGGLVYSTDSGRMCPACRQPVAACTCKQAAPPSSGDGKVVSGRIEPTKTFSFTFNDAGTFVYFCSVHPAMGATITVR